MLRKPGICQKPVITLYETPAYAAYGIAVGAEPTGVQPGTGTPENGGVADEILFGWQYEVLEENNAFYKIRTHYGYEGWIAAEEYVPMESVGGAGVCYDAQNSGCAMQLLQVCQNIADVLEAERVQARRITTLYAGSLIWAEKDSASGDSSAAARCSRAGDASFYRMEWAVLGKDICGAVFWSCARERNGGENGRRSGRRF